MEGIRTYQRYKTNKNEIDKKEIQNEFFVNQIFLTTKSVVFK